MTGEAMRAPVCVNLKTFPVKVEGPQLKASGNEVAIEAMRLLPNVVMPFPGGIVRSGSKIGSRYKALIASTNDAFCPTIRGQTARTALPPEVASTLPRETFVPDTSTALAWKLDGPALYTCRVSGGCAAASH